METTSSKEWKQKMQASRQAEMRPPLKVNAVSEYLVRWQQGGVEPADLVAALEELQTSYEELRVAEEELLQQNETLCDMRAIVEEERLRYQELFNLAPDGYIVTDHNGVISEANLAALEMLGIEMRFLLGKPMVAFIPEEHRSAFRDSVSRASKARRYEWSSWIRPRKGKVFPAVFTVARSDEHVLRWLVRDVTERRQIEDALFESNQTLTTLVQAAPVAITIVDVKGHVTLWNPAAEKLFGWRESQLMGRSFHTVTLPSVKDVALSAEDVALSAQDVALSAAASVSMCQEKMARGERIEGLEAVRRHRTGKLLQVELWTAPLHDAEGELVATVCVAIDIAERKAVEVTRRQLLERIVEVQEQERRRLSRELHDHLGQHLTALSLGLKSLQDTGSGPQRERRASGVKAAQLQGLVGDMMKTTHRLAWELRPAELDDMGLEAALQRYVEHWSENRGIETDFECNHDGSVRLADCVETTFFRITQEALNNVARHAGASYISVVLNCAHDSASVIIEDDGCGWDTNASGSKQRLGITGMRERLALVGGTLEIESEPGQGTTIFARIPFPENPRLEFPRRDVPMEP
ncbi:MAG TPA: PAS domain S-box protein [Abditibacteriaceae bacterium]